MFRLPLVKALPALKPIPMFLLPTLWTRAFAPTAVFFIPVVLSLRDSSPIAVLKLPLALLVSALSPTAVLLSPLLPNSALFPAAVLRLPVELPWSALAPVAVLPSPVVVFSSAAVPNAVLADPPVGPESTFMSALSPPAVLLFASLPVGFGGALQLGVTGSIKRSPAIATLASRFMQFSSMRRASMRRTTRQVGHGSLREELRVEGIAADEPRPVPRHHHLVLQLHTERRAGLAGVALETQHHVLLQFPLGHDPPRPAAAVRVRDAGALVLQPGLVDHRRVALGLIPRRQPRRPVRELLEGDPRPHERHHTGEAVVCHAVCLPLRRR